MVLLQHFESKVYGNGCNALTAACNASRSHAILVHTMRFTLEQTRDNSCIMKHSNSVCNTSNKSTKHESRHVTTLEKYSNRLFPFDIVGEALPLHIDERSNQKRLTRCSIPAQVLIRSNPGGAPGIQHLISTLRCYVSRFLTHSH